MVTWQRALPLLAIRFLLEAFASPLVLKGAEAIHARYPWFEILYAQVAINIAILVVAYAGLGLVIWILGRRKRALDRKARRATQKASARGSQSKSKRRRKGSRSTTKPGA